MILDAAKKEEPQLWAIGGTSAAADNASVIMSL